MLPRKFYIDDVIDSLMESDKKEMLCDISVIDGKYVVEMDLPGYKKEDIKLECNKGYLIISCSKESQKEEKDENKKYLRRERSFGKYSRSFYLGDVDEESIDATFENGTLTVTVPKASQEKNKKYIDIK